MSTFSKTTLKSQSKGFLKNSGSMTASHTTTKYIVSPKLIQLPEDYASLNLNYSPTAKQQTWKKKGHPETK